MKSATVDAQAATLNHAKQFTANPVLSSGTNSVSVAAVDGGDNQETVGFDMPVDTASSQSLTYDANGNMTSDGTNSFEWDCENRLIKIVYPGVNNFSELVYDGLGRNAQIVETEDGSVTSNKQFVFSGDKKREERNGSGVLTKKFFKRGQQDGSSNAFYVREHLGSATEITDDSADVLTRYSYAPFGDVLSTLGSYNSDFQFSGYYRHARSQINLTENRAYRSDLARFLSRDPIAEFGGTNLFAYVENNPVLFSDPSGLQKQGSVEYNEYIPPTSPPDEPVGDFDGGSGEGPYIPPPPPPDDCVPPSHCEGLPKRPFRPNTNDEPCCNGDGKSCCLEPDGTLYDPKGRKVCGTGPPPASPPAPTPNA